MVYHYNLPKSLENYSQEIGRAGRDGEESICETLAATEDLATLENFARGNTPSLPSLEQLLQLVFSGDESLTISLYQTSRALDLRDLVLKTLLTYLEIDGYIQGGTPVYSEYRFKAKQPSASILDAFEGERRTFLRNVFREAKRGRTWLTINVTSVCEQLGCDRERVVRALEYLNEKDWIDLSASGIEHTYQIVKSPDNQQELAEQLHARMTQHERNELDRLQQVVTLIESDTCQTNLLCAHFGEHRDDPCGHCTACNDEGKLALPAIAARTITADDQQRIAELRSEHADAFSEPSVLARFLCGVKSPALTRHKLGRHPDFGCMSDCAFETVVAYVSECS